jgi:hypothetical protein
VKRIIEALRRAAIRVNAAAIVSEGYAYSTSALRVIC